MNSDESIFEVEQNMVKLTQSLGIECFIGVSTRFALFCNKEIVNQNKKE